MTVVQFLKTKSIDDSLEALFIEFAQMHCKEQAKAIIDNVEIINYDEHGQYSPSVNEDSILNAYPLTNIK